MPIRLNIEAESVEEFDKLIARFSRSGATAAIMPEIAHTPAAQEAVAAAEPAKGKGRKGSASAATAADGAKSEGSTAGTDTSGSTTSTSSTATTAASPSEAAAVDPFATPGAEATSGTPAATSPADQAAADAGEVTIQQLKDAMADLLKAKSASFAMQTLEAATGCKSLTSGSPSVVEKAKDDPTIFRKTLDALVAAKTAA